MPRLPVPRRRRRPAARPGRRVPAHGRPAAGQPAGRDQPAPGHEARLAARPPRRPPGAGSHPGGEPGIAGGDPALRSRQERSAPDLRQVLDAGLHDEVPRRQHAAGPAVADTGRSAGVLSRAECAGGAVPDTVWNQDSSAGSLGDRLAHPGALADVLLEQAESAQAARAQVTSFARPLGLREQAILRRRLLADPPESLRSLGRHFSVSGERIRQIERKLRVALRRQGQAKGTGRRSRWRRRERATGGGSPQGQRTILPPTPPASSRRWASATPSSPMRSAIRGRMAPLARSWSRASRSARYQSRCRRRCAMTE